MQRVNTDSHEDHAKLPFLFPAILPDIPRVPFCYSSCLHSHPFYSSRPMLLLALNPSISLLVSSSSPSLSDVLSTCFRSTSFFVTLPLRVQTSSLSLFFSYLSRRAAIAEHIHPPPPIPPLFECVDSTCRREIPCCK